MNYFAEEKLPLPEFRTIGEGFQVTVFTSIVGELKNVGVNEGLKTLLDVIKRNEGVQAKDLPEQLENRPIKSPI